MIRIYPFSPGEMRDEKVREFCREKETEVNRLLLQHPEQYDILITELEKMLDGKFVVKEIKRGE
jgi:hypothetical protein